MLKVALNSLEEYYGRYLAPGGEKLPVTDPSADMIFGTRFHEILLEPDAFAVKYAIEPDVDPDGKFLDKRWKSQKTGWQSCRNMSQKQKDFMFDWDALNYHKEAVPSADHKKMVAMCEKVMGSSSARQLITLPGETEYSCKWIHEATGAEMKGRWDRVIFGADIIVNVKTSREYTREGFKKQIIDYSYDLQAAVSIDGYQKAFGGKPRYVFLMCSKHPPFEIETYELGDMSILAGRSQYEAALQLIKDGHDTGYWRSPTHGGIFPIDALEWHLRFWGAK